MAASVGVARRPGCAGHGNLFLFGCASFAARVASVLGDRLEDPSTPRATTHTRTLSRRWDSLLRGGDAESGGAAVDSGLGGGGVIWRALRARLDVEFASWTAHPEQQIADARNRTQLGMDDCGSCAGHSIHRRTGAGRKVSCGEVSGRRRSARLIWVSSMSERGDFATVHLHGYSCPDAIPWSVARL